jgi:hypothetical protein
MVPRRRGDLLSIAIAVPLAFHLPFLDVLLLSSVALMRFVVRLVRLVRLERLERLVRFDAF